MADGTYLHLDAATLTTMQAAALRNWTAIHEAMQSYSVSQRSHQRAALADVQRDLSEISYALSVVGGNVDSFSHADLSHGP